MTLFQTSQYANSRRLVFESVETEEQEKSLKLMNCDYVQGYYFSKPITPEELVLKLENYVHE
ncbi:EAL domain-containing protein [Methylophaga sp. UBA2689]|jgi:EAL domain-containing protein (putative c-di-GMP-specific phosphodiesterase class I)|uniref:EAL domain-containing protein n=1 Tax=Methylophaga sp. UBA2689 TaxID=1946878 RepID=UPI0025FDD000|nr:EAL domain-containing protein [Methylophaga sp. UBA2689]|tara:strand:+ start:171 stop:356 length:186 start_codon:yes stop_codon:yes gene_type:complete